jgi:hypothetical protein
MGALALMLFLPACGHELLVPPELPTGAERLTPVPATYSQWWSDTERCAGQFGAVARVEWFVVPDSRSFVYRGTAWDGYWWGEIHRIVLASAYTEDSSIVRHEMLHDLLGRGDHPAEYFQRRCAQVVECNAVCRSDSRG